MTITLDQWNNWTEHKSLWNLWHGKNRYVQISVRVISGDCSVDMSVVDVDNAPAVQEDFILTAAKLTPQIGLLLDFDPKLLVHESSYLEFKSYGENAVIELTWLATT